MIKVLIVDDDEVVRDYLSHLLTRLGYEPYLATNGAEGRALMENPEIQVVIADMYLPDMPDLSEWLEQLRVMSNGRPLIAITGDASNELMEMAKKAGVIAFLTKPFELTFIKKLLAKAMAPQTDENPPQ